MGNPIYTAIIVMALGLTLLVPNGIGLASLAMIITRSQLQVRLIEEPYLHHIHGSSYHDYAARVGRFLPGTGRAAPCAAAGSPSMVRRQDGLVSWPPVR